MVKQIILSVLFVSLYWGSATCSEKVVLTYFDFPPYEFQENDTPRGILITIVKEVFRQADIPLELEYLPFKRGYHYVQNGKLDGIFNFYKIDDRLAYFDYSEPIIKNPLHFFSRKDASFKYDTLDDLKGLKIGLLRGYTYGKAFDDSQIFVKDIADSHLSNLKKLEYERIDLYPCDELVGIYLAKQNNLMSELKILPKPLKVMDGYIGFTKGKHRKVIDKINPIILEMKNNGKIESIINKYFELN